MKPCLAGGGSGASRTDGADGGVIGPEDPAEKGNANARRHDQMSRNRRCRQQNMPWEMSSETAAEHILLADDDLAADGDLLAEGDEDGASPWAPSRWEVFLCSISRALPSSAAGPLLGLGAPSDVVVSLGKRKQFQRPEESAARRERASICSTRPPQKRVNVSSTMNKNKAVTFQQSICSAFFYRS